MENLKNNWADYAVALSKAAAAAIPQAPGLGRLEALGGFVGEAIGMLIPNQRMDRISRFLTKLEVRVSHLEKERLKIKLTHHETIDLLEDGILQAARALSDERLVYLSALLAGNIADDSFSYQEAKRLFAILGELTDLEIIILASKDPDRHPQRDPEFWERHKTALTPRYAVHGSSQKDIDEATIYSSYRQHLAQLQLLQPTFRSTRRGELPEFDDKTGMMKASGDDLTALGSLLLKRIDMAGKG